MYYYLMFENGVVLEVTQTDGSLIVIHRMFENGVVLEVTQTWIYICITI